jgi:hypothetical protein
MRGIVFVGSLLPGGDGYYTIPPGWGAMNNEPACRPMSNASGLSKPANVRRNWRMPPFELDPTLRIFGKMSAEDRKHAFRYICAAPPVDWEG